MDAFRLCVGCNRHVKSSAERCPFCDSSLAARAARGPEWCWSGATRATLVAAAMAGCETARPAPAPMAAPPATEPTAAPLTDAALTPDAASLAQRIEPAMMAVAYGAPPSEYAREGAVRGRVVVGEVDSESVGSTNSERAVSVVLRSRSPTLRSCYERELRLNPTLAGVLSVRFVIDAAGRVTELRASGLDQSEAVRACVGLIIRRMVFPAPASAPEAVSANLRFEVSS